MRRELPTELSEYLSQRFGYAVQFKPAPIPASEKHGVLEFGFNGEFGFHAREGWRLKKIWHPIAELNIKVREGYSEELGTFGTYTLDFNLQKKTQCHMWDEPFSDGWPENDILNTVKEMIDLHFDHGLRT